MRELAAIYSNYFTVIATPGVVKLVFGEAFGSPETAVFHVAVALTPSDAKALADTLLNFLKQAYPQASPGATSGS
jgi:hypothetical protein